MKKYMFLMLTFATLLASSCKKEYMAGPKSNSNTVDTVFINGNGNNGNNTGNWVPTPTVATISGNEFTWNLSNSVVNPAGKELFVVWISTNGVVNYNKLSEGVSGVFSAGTVTGGVIKFQLNPSYTKLKFNIAVNGGSPSNTWYWFTAQGGFVQKPCQHTNGSWCFDDGTNNLFSASYSTSSSTWIPGDPC